MDISKQKVVIATHYLVYGAPQALREYLMERKVSRLVFIAHPLLASESKSYCEIIVDGTANAKREINIRTRIGVLNYIIECFFSVLWILREKEKINLWVGVDPLNATLGLFFQKLGKVEKVVYYTIDYVPERFKNKWLNNFYHWLDKICVKNAEETWNVSYRIAEGREKIRGLRQSEYNKQKLVPIGVWFERVKRLPFEQVKKQQLLFLGNLLEKQGVQLVLDAIPKIIQDIPLFHFLIVGGGEYESALKKKTEDLQLGSRVTFTGWIKERSELDQMMADSALAIAMYDKDKDNFTYYADPTKLKDYLSAGLPVLLTDVPHNAQEIQAKNCGKIVAYDKDKIAQAVVTLMKDENTLKQYRKNALEYIQQFDWNKIFEENLSRVINN